MVGHTQVFSPSTRDTRLHDAQYGQESPCTLHAPGVALRHAFCHPPTAPRHTSSENQQFSDSVGMCALESVDAAHERRRKALTHFLLVVRGRQYREDRVEQTVDAAADGIGWRNRRAGLDIQWEEALRRGRLVWRPPSWGVRSTWRPDHGRIQVRAMPFGHLYRIPFREKLVG